MTDLVVLNSRLVAHFMGAETATHQSGYVEFLPVCLGRFLPSIQSMRTLLFGVRPTATNPSGVVYVNRDYLNYARLVCKDIAGGHFERLVELGIALDVAEFISELSNDQVTRLASCWPGAIVEVDVDAFNKGAKLHASAGRYHASAYVAVGR